MLRSIKEDEVVNSIQLDQVLNANSKYMLVLDQVPLHPQNHHFVTTMLINYRESLSE